MNESTTVIVDNGSAPSGWQVNTSGQDYGSDYLYSPGSSGNDVSWTPTLSAGDYDTYAWWVHDSQYSSSVPYSIVHNSVTDVVNVDQSANGGSWQLLGNYTFDGSGSEYISVSDSTGKTTADAVRLVQTSSGGTQTVINYVHVDHLGTPVAMTDENGVTTWQATYDPFGLATIEVASTNTLNIRFPGQYYDAESGLHYNYFRTYDPNTGRYITVDPLGIIESEDLNLYRYVENNPIRWVDPFGLLTFSGGFGGSFQFGGAGASASGTIGFDTSGQICFQFTTCGRIGPGASAGASFNASVGEGYFCEGNSLSGGVFGEGGAGTFGGGSADYGSGGSSGTLNFKGGVGGGASGGAQACITRTKCF